MRDKDKFGSAHSVSEKIAATVVDETPDSYFVEYSDGDYVIEPKSEKNRLLFESDLVDGETHTITVSGQTGEGALVDVFANFDADIYEVGVNGEMISLDEERAFEVLSIVADDGSEDQEGDDEFLWNTASMYTVDDANSPPWSGNDVHAVEATDLTPQTADRLYDTYYETLASWVRRDVVRQFAQRFDDVEITDDGWVIKDTVLVTYEAENYLLEDVDAHVVDGDSTVEADQTHEFLDLSFDTQTETVVQVGEVEETLTEREQEFIATVETLCFPDEYLGQRLLKKLEAAYEDRPDSLAEMASSVDVGAFMDPVSGLVHRHDLQKHTLSATFSVNRWVVDELKYTSYDHAGVHELAHREAEFRASDRDVFWDTDNDDHTRWQQISDVVPNAPIPDRVQRDIKNTYE